MLQCSIKTLKLLLTFRRPVAYCLNRSYQSKQGVYGYNGPLHEQRTLSVFDNVSDLNYQAKLKESNLSRFVEAYRRHGHKYAKTNPFLTNHLGVGGAAELNPSNYGLTDDTLYNTEGVLHGIGNSAKSSLSDITKYLEQTYCGHVSLDMTAIETEVEHEWLCKHYEDMLTNREALSIHDKLKLAKEMLKSQNFDHFLATKFSNIKRYGGEGAEAMMGFFTELLFNAGKYGLKEVVIGMAHRGRLNVLTGMLEFPPVVMFRKMKGFPEFPPEQRGAGDVLSHMAISVNLEACGDFDKTSPLHVTMLPNPSHLEAVNPVTVGKVRGRHMTKSIGDYARDPDNGLVGDSMLCVQVHGDGAIVGQGVNQELLVMSNLPHFSVGGSLHLVIDNQLAFTTPRERSRSSRYASDIARLIGAPVLHVNGNCPEEVVKATKVALQYRQKFSKDVFVDVHCYRRWGHNELDDPTFTNPQLYNDIHSHGSTIPDAYFNALVDQGVVTQSDRDVILKEHNDILSNNFDQIESYTPKRQNLLKQWSSMSPAPHNVLTQWDTGLCPELLRYIGAKSVSAPEDMDVHPHLQKMHVSARRKRLEEGKNLEWGLCEALAIGSLLYQGFNVRISGQDVGRATFSHRHAMLVDQTSNEMYIPLNNLHADKDVGHLEIANSPLSEEAVLGFEYGFSIDSPKNLVIWEAQFGDFFNGAQIILDTFVSNGESKWGLQSALTMLLPHGMDGAGPEHSSCKFERFLQMSDSKENAVDGEDVNWHVVNPSNSAQYFHLLRRQMLRNFRKPLVVIAPKILLRLSAASSSMSQIAPGTFFHPVLNDPKAIENTKSVQKVVFVTGKHYYALTKHAEERQITDTAFIRLEQLCPFPTKELQDAVAIYPNAEKFVWSQEEHRNAGGWFFVQPRLKNLVGIGNLIYAGRGELCQSAVGVAQIHKKEEQQVLDDTFNS